MESSSNSGSVSQPEWVKDAVFYQIFPDRFARSAQVQKPANLEPWDSPPTVYGFKGGDLLGVRDHLDYLQDLGITAIYFCPVFRSAANHRYHTHDYYAIDPLLGGNDALSALLAGAHERGMRVILDGVFNHASRGFFQFNSILENGGEAPYLDWFHVYAWPLHPYGPGDLPPNYECWWNLPALPKFNTSNPEVREFLWTVGAYWINQGIDGWRLDVPNEIDDDSFWREFRRRVKAANPEAYIVGEIWGDASRWLQGDQFDAVMNYLFTRACLGFFANSGSGLDHGVIEGSGLHPVPPLNAGEFRGTIDHILRLYPWSATLSQLNLLDSHDTPRYLTMACDDTSSLRLAVLFQMTFPGAPCVYYGDEIGMRGGKDPLCRGSFVWDSALWDHDLLEYMKRTIRLRRENTVFRRGDYVSLLGEADVYAFARLDGKDVAVVALNTSRDSRRVTIPLGFQLHGAKSAWEGETPTLTADSIREWYLPPRSGAILLGQR